ncbi:DUF7537 family lipoprotein [Natronomonas sp. EA1]|uniref:DUF7537 family lipoprotein n=1 Tax=Natronomonas sp. EA1 TaxID=3421655 RepID=UPI003EBCDF9F
MSRTTLALVGLVVLLVLAGCNAPATETERTLTPAPVPETASPTPTRALAPGVDSAGVFDSPALASAHARVLGEASYTVNQTVFQQYPNGTVDARYVTVARFAADHTVFRSTLRQADRRDGRLVTRRVERYGDGSRVYEAVTAENETTYGVVRGPDGEPRSPVNVFPANLTNRRPIERLFTLVETETVETRARNGTRFVRVATTEPQRLPPLRNVTLTATVREDGVVTAYRVTYDVDRGEGRIDVLVALEYTAIGETTPEAPPWLDRARD